MAPRKKPVDRAKVGPPSPESEALEEDFTPFTLFPTVSTIRGFAAAKGFAEAFGNAAARSVGKFAGAAAAADQGKELKKKTGMTRRKSAPTETPPRRPRREK